MMGFDARAARAAWSVFLVGLLVAAVYFVRTVLLVFVLAILFAYLLAPLVNLQLLHLRANAVVDLTPLTGMTKLIQLDITQNAITDLAPLVANTGLGAGDTVWVGYNPLSTQALTVDIPALQARGVIVLGP